MAKKLSREDPRRKIVAKWLYQREWIHAQLVCKSKELAMRKLMRGIRKDGTDPLGRFLRELDAARPRSSRRTRTKRRGK